jgi:Xaa-Pro aminopeptidase
MCTWIGPRPSGLRPCGGRRRGRWWVTDRIEAARLKAEEFGSEWEFEVREWWETEPQAPEGFATDFPVDLIAELRFSLTRHEIERVTALGADCGDAMGRVLRGMRPGESEIEIAARLAAELTRLEIAAPVILVAADERIERFRHPLPTGNRAQRALMAVLCGQRHGLIVALTRIVHFGRLPDDLRRRHDAVCAVDEALHRATVPGARWCDALQTAIHAYRAQGFADEWEKHHQGGPLGYETRDFKATPAETRTIQTDQLVAWNPSITGTKSEDTILAAGLGRAGVTLVTSTKNWPMRGSRADILVI